MEWRRKSTVTPLGAMVLSWGQGGHPVQSSDHTWLTTKVRIAMLTTEGAVRQAVKSHVQQGKVTLTGTVESRAEKDTAEATASAVPGVIAVHNLLRVGRTSRQEGVLVGAVELKRAVEKAFEADKNLGAVKVLSVTRGRVSLGGSVTELGFELRAVETTYAVAGVLQVTSAIATRKSPGTAGEVAGPRG